jgi:hypothetical protein
MPAKKHAVNPIVWVNLTLDIDSTLWVQFGIRWIPFPSSILRMIVQWPFLFSFGVQLRWVSSLHLFIASIDWNTTLHLSNNQGNNHDYFQYSSRPQHSHCRPKDFCRAQEGCCSYPIRSCSRISTWFAKEINCFRWFNWEFLSYKWWLYSRLPLVESWWWCAVRDSRVKASIAWTFLRWITDSFRVF